MISIRVGLYFYNCRNVNMSHMSVSNSTNAVGVVMYSVASENYIGLMRAIKMSLEVEGSLWSSTIVSRGTIPVERTIHKLRTIVMLCTLLRRVHVFSLQQ